MENGGNKKVNAIFEAHLTISKPSNTASGPIRERFIRDKYERRKFYDANAFATVETMAPSRGECNDTQLGEEQQVIAGVQRRLAGRNSNGGAAPSIRKPSDAARKRVEERAARNRGVSMNSNTTSRSKIKTPAAVAPAPAPVADLLDFGDFDSPEATAAVASSNGGVGNSNGNAAPTNDPGLDLFANMSVGEANGGESSMPQQQQQQQVQQQQKMSNADILNMFNTPNQNVMQQNMFAMGQGMPSGGNMMMNQPSNPGNFNMMMNNNNFGSNNPMMMNGMPMQQTNNSMMMGGNNMMNGMNNPMMMNNASMMNNQMMMMQQPQQFQGMPMNSMQGGGMMGGNQFGQSAQSMGQQQSSQKQTSRGGSHDQFAEFGNFRR